MTVKQLKRGEDLQKIIKDCKEFFEIFDKINSSNCDQSQLTVNITSRRDAASIALSKCPNVVDAIKYQLRAAITAYEEEFAQL